ncbi:MAG TPA: cbb3-type cytochrome c oxidase subunit I [Vicinamibacterales bacterium]|nr:cbb3-type cytochrome c oxidase subunit I [Vicinamibacterales bacterium]
MLTNHRTVGLQYAFTALGFLFVGFLLMLLIRWQLAWPTAALPPAVASMVGEANAPGGYMLPEFYNQLVAMHGTVMIFLAVVPLLTGAFANYLVPLQIGAPDMAFPRLNAASYWIFLISGLLMLASFFVTGGAANSGWTSYPPLAVMATRGQDFWLVGVFLLGLSSMLNAINVITTIVQLRVQMPFMRLPFFVWSQLVAALLLLLAFPSLQAAAIFQLMDRLAGTSFFLPTGLVVSGAPVTGLSGGGNPLLWQHLFWFLGHPEVYVLVLPAIGIVSEVITVNTRRPLWGYRGMVMSVLFLSVMSMLVWAHHMFLTGMGTTVGAFFQVTTMIVSIPSVVLITSLMVSLWGGSIRFTTPMLFALAFLPMFGIGGLSGLPLGLAASDVALHDTWYVVGHFHYLVAPGTLFAIFAGIYHWFPKVTGRAMHRGLGLVHFWGTFIAMNGIFLPMFTLGLRGINRRLYDGGLHYAHAQSAGPVNEYMTIAALALAVFQLPFLINLVVSARRGARTGDNPWDATTREWQVSEPHTGAIPFAYQPHADTRVSNARMGMWLFLASEVMFFGSLFSAYVLLRVGSTSWPADSGLGLTTAVSHSVLLALATITALRGRWAASSLFAASFVAWKLAGYIEMFNAGLTPASNLMVACWFALTAAHALHVAGGVIANWWVARGASAKSAAQRSEQRQALRLYWYFVDGVWLAILIGFYFI